MGNRRMMQVPQKTRRQAAAPARWVRVCEQMCWGALDVLGVLGALGSLGLARFAAGFAGRSTARPQLALLLSPPQRADCRLFCSRQSEQHPAAGTGAPQTHPDLDRARPVLFALPFDE